MGPGGRKVIGACQIPRPKRSVQGFALCHSCTLESADKHQFRLGRLPQQHHTEGEGRMQRLALQCSALRTRATCQ